MHTNYKVVHQLQRNYNSLRLMILRQDSSFITPYKKGFINSCFKVRNSIFESYKVLFSSVRLLNNFYGSVTIQVIKDFSFVFNVLTRVVIILLIIKIPLNENIKLIKSLPDQLRTVSSPYSYESRSILKVVYFTNLISPHKLYTTKGLILKMETQDRGKKTKEH